MNGFDNRRKTVERKETKDQDTERVNERGRKCLSYRVNDGEKQREIMVEAMESEGEINVKAGDRERE